MTKVINIKDAPPGWQHNPDFVYIGRSGKALQGVWGNPFRMTSEQDRPKVIQSYIKWILEQPQIQDLSFISLKDKTLVCFCSPKLCHGDILALMADLWSQW
jgi:hypothetical protein